MWWKYALEVILWLASSKTVRMIAEITLRELVKRNDWRWDDELMDDLFGKEEK